MKKLLQHNLNHYLQTATLIVVIFIGFALGASLSSGPKAESPTVTQNRNLDADSAKKQQALAEQIVTTCKDASYRPTCYDEEIPKLMDRLSMEEAFAVTKIVQDLDHEYIYCHVLGHKLSAKETAKDPSKWKEVVARSPRGICSNGAIHGAFQERFRKEHLTDAEVEALKTELLGVCDARGSWSPTDLEQASCYHALGHLSMYITNGTIEKSISLCDTLAISGERDFSKLCYDGAFMQIFQPLEPDDFSLIKGKQPTKQQLPRFCAKFAAKYRGPCWNEGWPLYREQILTSSGYEKYCTNQFLTDPSDQERCLSALGYVVTAQLKLDLDKMHAFCGQIKNPDRQGTCYANAAGRMIETDYRNAPVALRLCAGIESENTKNICYTGLIRDAGHFFAPGAPEAKELCSKMPMPWQTECFSTIR